jgi:hypothetical protein
MSLLRTSGFKYIFQLARATQNKEESCPGTTRAVVLLLLVEPYDKLVRLAGPIQRSLSYLRCLPVGLSLTLMSLLGFGLIVVVNLGRCKGRHLALVPTRGAQTQVTVKQQEAAQGRRIRHPPITTCLCIYHSCLVSKQADEEHEESPAMATMAGAS